MMPMKMSCNPPMNRTLINNEAQPITALSVKKKVYKAYRMYPKLSTEIDNPRIVESLSGLVLKEVIPSIDKPNIFDVV